MGSNLGDGFVKRCSVAESLRPVLYLFSFLTFVFFALGLGNRFHHRFFFFFFFLKIRPQGSKSKATDSSVQEM